MNMKLYNLISKGVAVLSIFGATSFILIRRYPKEVTEEMISTSSIGIMPTIFILGILAVALWFVSNQFKEMLSQSKFGWLSIVFFGLTLGLILFGSWFVINSIVLSAQTDIDLFVLSMEYHRQTLFYMLYPIAFGISLGGISKLMNIDMIKKLFK